MVGKKHVGILALSAIADDPRVRRQGDAFYAAGWGVMAFGLSGSERSPAPLWQIVGCDTANVPDLESLDESPGAASAEDVYDASSEDQVLSQALGDDDLHASTLEEGLSDPSSDKSIDDRSNDPNPPADFSSATSTSAAAPSGRLRSTLKHLLPLPVRDVLRPYSTWASLRAEARVALQRCAAAWGLVTSPSGWVSILKHALPLPVRDALRPYFSWASLRAEARGALQKCVSLLPQGPGQFVRRRLQAASRMRSSVVTWALHTCHRARSVWRLLLIRILPDRADEVFWTLNGALLDLYRAAAYHRPAIWLANDWTTLPVAQRLAEEQNVPFGYDTHELATSEYGHRAKWRILYRPLILALERRGIARASVVSCVSDGIADHLHRLYRMEQRPMVIRNMPHYDPCALRPTQSSIRVLYHGIVSSGRGLEACISSVAHWVEGRSLAIRGPVQDSYRAELEALIAATGVEDRVTLLPPVPMIDLIREAAAFDIGIFIFPSANQHNAYVLPNKIFEYVMAGLAVCVSALPEMAALVRDHDLGVLVEGMEPEKIAAAINSLDRERIDLFKRNALKAAAELNWEAESPRMVAAYARALY
ncbi:MAG TPA: glycosyltransferase [Methyloceanibacter sp.]